MTGADIDTGGPTVQWVADPDGRGTVTLLTSCLLTLALCVWSVVYLDIPPRGTSRIQLWLLYTRWSVLTALGPELMVYVAWRQLNSARTLVAEVRKHAISRNDKPENGHRPSLSHRDEDPLSQIHEFYAGMGGFVFDLETGCSLELAACLPDLRRLTLTPRGAVLLTRCGLLPDVSREEIQDKNKVDHLAKMVVCVQAVWFLIQTSVRASQHLNVTLLEINTLAHVVCALVIYLLWWNKPSMIQEPTYLSGDWVPAICAYMYMSSQISIWERDRPGVSRRAWLDSELSALAYVKHEPSEDQDQSRNFDDHSDVLAGTAALQADRLRPRAVTSESVASMQEVSAFSKSSEKVSSSTAKDFKR